MGGRDVVAVQVGPEVQAEGLDVVQETGGVSLDVQAG